jgi:putative oxidoreductase
VKYLRHPGVYWAVAIVLGALFVYASLDKIGAPRDFARIVYHYRLAGPSAKLGFLPANLLAVVLPWVEIVCGVLLIVGVCRREAAVITAALLVTFVVAVSWALAHGIDIKNCGCFTVTSEGRSAGIRLILGDVAMLLAAVYVAALPPLRRQAEGVGEPAPAL